LDVRDSSEFLISVKGTPTTRAYYRSAVWGYLHFRVVNKLNHPDKTTPFVPILLYVSGNLQVASPRYTQTGDFDQIPDLNPKAYHSSEESAAAVAQQKAHLSAQAAEVKSLEDSERVVRIMPQGPVLSIAEASSDFAADVMAITTLADGALQQTVQYLENKYPQLSVPGSVALGSAAPTVLGVSTESAARGVRKPQLIRVENSKPQVMITDGTILDPGFTTNNAGCNISKYMQSTSCTTNEFLKTRTIVLKDTNTLSVYLEPLNVSPWDHATGNKANMGPLNTLNSIFLGSRSDISMITRAGEGYDGLFLVNQYNYGYKDYNVETVQNMKLFIPWDSNLLYAPYRFRGVDLGKRVYGVLGSLPNYHGFYPWYPSLTKIIRQF